MLSRSTPRARWDSTQMAALAGIKLNSRKFGIKSLDQVRRTPWHVLRENNDFRCYFLGSVTSDVGSWMQNSAQVLLAYQLDHSVLTVGLVTFAQFTSPLLLGAWAGVAADRFGGRRTLLATQLISASVAASLAGLDFAGLLSISVLVVGAIASGLAFTFALPARNITVQRLVQTDKLKPAYAMDSVSYNLGRALGPVLTMAMDLLGVSFAWAFTANAVSFIVFSAILWVLNMHAEAEPERRSRVRDGFRIAYRDKRIRVLLLMVAAVTIADDPILVLGPELAKQLHASPAWSGWFIAALGAGTVCGSFRRSKHKPAIRLAATALAALALCMLIFVFSHCVWVSCAAALGAGKRLGRKLRHPRGAGRARGTGSCRRGHGCMGDRLGRKQAVRVTDRRRAWQLDRAAVDRTHSRDTCANPGRPDRAATRFRGVARWNANHSLHSILIRDGQESTKILPLQSR